MRWIDCSILRNIYNSYLQEVIMKRKRNHSLRSSVFIFLAALFLLFTCSVSTIYASTLQKPDIAASGKFVKDGDYWIYRYDDKTIAKNVFLKIDKKTYYFNKLGHRWCSWHTIKGKNYYFGTRSQGYLIKNSLIWVRRSLTSPSMRQTHAAL